MQESFYGFMLNYLNHNRCCPKCNERMWVSYSDIKCYVNKSSLDLAGYIGNWARNVPNSQLPDKIEFIPYPIDPRDPPGWKKPHEGYYRLK